MCYVRITHEVMDTKYFCTWGMLGKVLEKLKRKMYTYMSVWTHLYPSAMGSNDNVQQVQIYIFSIDFRIFLERSPET